MSMAIGYGRDDSTDSYAFLSAHGEAGISQRPEHRLMFELLADAIRLFQGRVRAHTPYGDAEKRARKASKVVGEAEGWIADDNDELFGFVSVCGCLGINPQALRKGLARWRMRREAGEAVEAVARRRPAHPGQGRDMISEPRYARRRQT